MNTVDSGYNMKYTINVVRNQTGGESVKNICIYSYKVANQLISNGFKIVSIRENKKHDGFLVFYFKDENNIQEFLKSLQQTNKTNKQKENEDESTLCSNT